MPRQPPSVGSKGRKRPREWDDVSTITRTKQPLCQLCLAAGRTRPATCTDHIVPLAEGGSLLDPANLQPLCRECHERKTADENATRERPGLNDCKVRVVCGPPGAGKSTYVARRFKKGDMVWDLDAVAELVAKSPQGDEHRTNYLSALLMMREAMITAACDGHVPGTLFVIVTTHERADAIAARSGGEIEYVSTPIDDCLARLESRRLPPATTTRLASIVTAWHAIHACR